jgi:hypothetical protein
VWVAACILIGAATQRLTGRLAITLFDDARQERVLAELRASARPCVVRNEFLAATWVGNGPPPAGPLISYIQNEFELAGLVGRFDLAVPLEARAEPAG